jgi:uncharacterized protein (DUF608 family)
MDLEFKISEYLLNHFSEVREDILQLKIEAEDNPILSSYLQDAILDEVIRTLCAALNLSYESVASVIDKDFLMALFGPDWYVL